MCRPPMSEFLNRSLFSRRPDSLAAFLRGGEAAKEQPSHFPIKFSNRALECTGAGDDPVPLRNARIAFFMGFSRFRTVRAEEGRHHKLGRGSPIRWPPACARSWPNAAPGPEARPTCCEPGPILPGTAF